VANFEAMVLYAAVGTAYKSAGFLWSGGTKRAQVYEIEFGQNGALASQDCQCQWDLSRAATPSLAGNTVAANALDPGDYTAGTLWMNGATAEATMTTAGNGLNLKNWAINQRGFNRWRALDDGDNIIIPSTGGNGVALRVLSSNYTSTAVGNLSFIER
jgi:hypothetical protein